MSRRQRRNKGPAAGIVLALFLLALFAGVAWWSTRSRETTTTSPTGSASTDAPATPARPGATPLELPELAASDEFVRNLVVGLSAHPQLASWLVSDELVHRFVGIVVDLAGGLSPTERAEFLIPDVEFPVRRAGESTVMDPAGHARYGLLTETFISLDTRGTATLYHQLHPLFEEAYDELGIPDQRFDDAVDLAIANLLAAEVTGGPYEVHPNEAIYEFSDPDLETRSSAEKHLIRMGPENAGRIQTKLTELRDAIAATANPRPGR